MTYVLPLPLPEHMVRDHGVVPGNDFQQRHVAFGSGPDGRGYVASDVFYNHRRYGDDDDRSYRAWVVTLLDASFSIVRQVTLEALAHEMTHVVNERGVEHFSFNDDASFAVTPRGEVVFATQKNRTFVLDAEVGERVATFDPARGGPEGVSDVAALPSGRLLCLKSHDSLFLSDASPSFRDGMPALASVGPIVGEGSVSAKVGWYGGFRGYIGDVVGLDDDRFMVPLLEARSRGGYLNKDAFRYAIADARGELVGCLPLGEADTPYEPDPDSHVRCLALPRLGGWLTRSHHAVRLFDRDGAAILRIGVGEDERFANLRPLQLFGVGPGGEILLVQRRHHLLVVTHPVSRAEDLERTLLEASAVVRSEHNRLKKVASWVGGRFLGFEARTAPAALPKPRKTRAKKAKAAAPADAPAEPAPPADPEEAMAARPDDLAARAVYADWLSQKGDPLGERVAIGCRLEAMGARDPERQPLEERSEELMRKHGRAWLARWNTPHRLFEEPLDMFAGLPRGVKLEALPRSLEELDVQLGKLPIGHLTLELGARAIMRLDKLRTLRRIHGLWVSGSSKIKLGDSVTRWLAAQSLTSLQRLWLYRVELTGARAQALLESLPALTELTFSRCDLSADALAVLSESPAVARVRKLALRDNPLSTAGFEALRKWRGLTDLDVSGCDLGDDLCAIDAGASPFPITTLRIRDNRRLGPEGLAWIARAFPELRALEPPSHLSPASLDALAPLAPGLEDLNLQQTEPATRARFLAAFVPLATRLRRVNLSLGPCAGLLPGILSLPALAELDMSMGKVGDADVVALARSTGAASLRKLELGGDITDAAAAELGRSPHLADLESLAVHSRSLTERGAGALLAGAMPSLTRLMLWEAEIRDAEPLCVKRGSFQLRLYKCKIAGRALERLRGHWGHQLSPS